MSQLYALLQSLNQCEVAGLNCNSNLCCSVHPDILFQLENTFHKDDSDSMEFMRQSTQVFKACEKEQKELMNTVNLFINGYCDALSNVDFLGNKSKDSLSNSSSSSDCVEVVDITSDDSCDDTPFAKQEINNHEIDDSDVGKALLSYIEGKEESSEGEEEIPHKQGTQSELKKWLFGHMSSSCPESERIIISQKTKTFQNDNNDNNWDSRRRLNNPIMSNV